jgi:hypothetical protein
MKFGVLLKRIRLFSKLMGSVFLCLIMWSGTVFAHQTGNSYLTLKEADGSFMVELDFIVRDLGNLLQVPGQPSDPPPAPDKLAALQVPITQVIQQSLSIAVDEQDIPLEFMSQSVVLHNDGLYVRQRFSAKALSADVKFVVVRYQFFTQNDMLGRAFFKLSLRGEEISSVFDQSNAIQRFALGEGKRWATMGLFTQEGAKHIWEGPDHLLFLLTLLLPGLMLIRPAGSSTASGSTAAWKFALKVITAFTVAHSITLACSVLGWVSLPDRFIESMIALSIMLSAALNLQNRFTFSHWKLAFVFGLIHGMGFANGLKELGLSSLYFLEALFAFNLGVELGQLSAVVLVAVPLVLLARREESRLQVMRWGSGMVFLIALVWLVQRLFG